MNKQILVVDDSKPTRFAMKTTIENYMNRCQNEKLIHYNCQIYEKSNGKEALEFVQSINNNIDMIFVDVNMPVMDGITFIKESKKLSNCQNAPIIVISVESNPTIIADLKAIGANGWLGKPIQPDLLLKVVDKFLINK